MRASSAEPVKQWSTPVTPPSRTAAREDLGGVVLGVAGVDDQRQAGLARGVDMRLEPLALRLAVGLVVIIIEAALADRDHTRMCGGSTSAAAPRSGCASASCGWTPTVAQTSAFALGDAR